MKLSIFTALVVSASAVSNFNLGDALRNMGNQVRDSVNSYPDILDC